MSRYTICAVPELHRVGARRGRALEGDAGLTNEIGTPDPN